MKTIGELLRESKSEDYVLGYFKAFNEDRIISKLKQSIKDLEQIKKSKKKMIDSNFSDKESTKDVYLAYLNLYGYELGNHFNKDIVTSLAKFQKGA